MSKGFGRKQQNIQIELFQKDDTNFPEEVRQSILESYDKTRLFYYIKVVRKGFVYYGLGNPFVQDGAKIYAACYWQPPADKTAPTDWLMSHDSKDLRRVCKLVGLRAKLDISLKRRAKEEA